MSETKTLAQLQTSAVAKPQEEMSFLTAGGFDQLLRVANMLSSSSMVPVAYRKNKEIKEFGQVTGWEDNPAALANCAVALNMAHRMNADPLLIMQNLHIIEGRPSWSSPFIIAAINSCGRYNSLDYELSEPGEPVEIEYIAIEWVKRQKNEVKKTVTVRHQTCKAYTTEKSTGKRLESPLISIQMAIDEGWLTKKGSKWQTMPELMLRYRCASFFGRLYAPELLMGLPSAEEAEDIPTVQQPDGTYVVNVEDLQAAQAQAQLTADSAKAKRTPKADKAKPETVNKGTGEITPGGEPEAVESKESIAARESREQAEREQQEDDEPEAELTEARTDDLPSFE